MTKVKTKFLKHLVMLQKIPFEIRRDNPNIETIAAMDEFYEIKNHPQNYKKYSSFRDAMNDVCKMLKIISSKKI